MYIYIINIVIRLGLATIIGTLVGITTFFVSARVTANIPILLIAAAITLLAATGGFTWLINSKLPRSYRLRLSASLALGTLLVAWLLATITILRPFNFPYSPLAATQKTHYCNLSTGSRIAYELYPAVENAFSTPIIFLHGGPGVPLQDANYLTKPLGEAGFDVYSYDRVGSGRSQRLPDVRSYTVTRHVADLEAIRQEIGAERILILGGSWGATLAAHYMAEHPEHVAKAILFAPGILWPPGLSESSKSPADIIQDIQLSPKEPPAISVVYQMPRYRAWELLFQINPQAAYNLAGDREMDGFMEKLLYTSVGLSNMKCDPNKPFPPLKIRGNGWYVNQMTDLSLMMVKDPRPKLKQHPIPTLLLRGECDSIPWSATEQYLESLPIVTLLNIKNAGHLITIEQPDIFFAAVKAFLLDQPLPASLSYVFKIFPKNLS